MGLIIAQVSQAYDTLLARDKMVNVLWFDHHQISVLAGTDWDALALDLANAYHDNRQASTETTVKLYAADDPKPRPVKGQAVVQPGAVVSYGAPREVCLCLSFYADRNLPSRRGRIFLPVPAGPNGAPGIRPSTNARTQALALAGDLSALGGLNVDWVVHSQKLQQHYKVSNVWVDDEWDTMRSRGLKSTTRSVQAVSG